MIRYGVGFEYIAGVKPKWMWCAAIGGGTYQTPDINAAYTYRTYGWGNNKDYDVVVKEIGDNE